MKLDKKMIGLIVVLGAMVAAYLGVDLRGVAVGSSLCDAPVAVVAPAVSQ